MSVRQPSIYTMPVYLRRFFDGNDGDISSSTTALRYLHVSLGRRRNRLCAMQRERKRKALSIDVASLAGGRLSRRHHEHHFRLRRLALTFPSLCLSFAPRRITRPPSHHSTDKQPCRPAYTSHAKRGDTSRAVTVVSESTASILAAAVMPVASIITGS